MCGIAGYVGSRELDPATCERCLESLRHRGPDASGLRDFVDTAGRRVSIFSTRLDIIDIDERSNQPFNVGSKWVAYNGELYNYVELREELRRLGRTFATESDTEVLVAAIDEWGLDALDRCEGMWSFALYDELDGSLTLVRDRFGEKPLYLYRDGSDLYFGSEPKAIVALLGRPLEVDVDHLHRYLVNGYRAMHGVEQTFFRGLEELGPGEWLRLAPSGERRGSYWKPSLASDDSLSFEDAVAGVRERLIRAVELRLRADVPLAFCMSGGVDSLSLISIAQRIFGYDVHGFTVVEDDPRYSEKEMIEYAVRELGVRHTEIPVETHDFLSRLRELVRSHDGPVQTISYFAQWLLMKRIAEHGYKISISGTAADELFSGYYDHHLAYLYEVRGDAELWQRSHAAWVEHVLPVVRNPHLRNANLFVDDPVFRGHLNLGADEFSQYLMRPWSEPMRERPYCDDLLRNRMLNELFHEVVPVILHEDDLNAMYYSVENRSPFLDRPLFEFSQRIPTAHLAREGRLKAVLREAMRGIVPDDVLDSRRKVGFNASIHSFLDVRDPEVQRELRADSPVYDYVNRDAIARLIERDTLPNSESKFLFNFLNCKLFLEEFAAGASARAA
jgi:asparagine synthase (glutamine-hydrolysing)